MKTRKRTSGIDEEESASPKKLKMDENKKLTIQELYNLKQKKKCESIPKEKKIDEKLKVKNPTIRVLKLYNGRNDKEAVKNGWSLYPVSTKDDPLISVNVCSSGNRRDLSPMILGPVIDEFGTELGLNIEDCWQGMKVWKMHMNGGVFDPKQKFLWKNGTKNIDPDSDEWIPEWKKWSDYICFSGEAARHRVKIDKNENVPNKNVPLFSYYRGKRYPYAKARKLMYVRWYAKLVQETGSFKYLKKIFDEGVPLVLLDYDGQDRPFKDENLKQKEDVIFINSENEKLNQSMEKRINDETKIFGHGFVLACVLCGIDVWSNEQF